MFQLFKIAVASLGMFLVAAFLFFLWLDEPVDGTPVDLRQLVEDFIADGDCGSALALAYRGVVERAWDAPEIWGFVRHSPECGEGEKASVFDHVMETSLLGYKFEHNYPLATDIEVDPYKEWISFDVADGPQGTVLLLHRRYAFAYRCYGAFADMGLPDEMRLRRILSEEFETLDLLSGPWTRRIPGCRAAALRLAADARERATQAEWESYVSWWQRHAEWLEGWAEMFEGF